MYILDRYVIINITKDKGDIDMARYRADNKTINGEVPVIEATKSDIEFEAKRFFNWRGSTKKYNSVFDRVMAQG